MKIKIILFCAISLFLIACSNGVDNAWKESDTFQVGIYTMRGEENKIGFIDHAFEEGKQQKYMWHFWSDEQDLEGPFKVIAEKESDRRAITIFETSSIGGPNNGAQGHAPSTMSLPEKGMWRLDAYINEVLFGSVFIRVT